MGSQLKGLIIPSGGTVLSYKQVFKNRFSQPTNGSGVEREGRGKCEITHLLTTYSQLCCLPGAYNTVEGALDRESENQGLNPGSANCQVHNVGQVISFLLSLCFLICNVEILRVPMISGRCDDYSLEMHIKNLMQHVALGKCSTDIHQHDYYLLQAIWPGIAVFSTRPGNLL